MTTKEAGHSVDKFCRPLPSGLPQLFLVLLLYTINLTLLCTAIKFPKFLGYDTSGYIFMFGVSMVLLMLGVVAGVRPVICSLALAATPTSVILYEELLFKCHDFPQIPDFSCPYCLWFEPFILVFFFKYFLLLVSVGYVVFAACKWTIWQNIREGGDFFRWADVYCLTLACLAVPLLILLSHVLLLHTPLIKYVPRLEMGLLHAPWMESPFSQILG